MQLLNQAGNLSKDHFTYLYYCISYLNTQSFPEITTRSRELSCVGEDST